MDFNSNKTYIISNVKLNSNDKSRAKFISSGESFIKRCETIFDKITRNS